MATIYVSKEVKKDILDAIAIFKKEIGWHPTPNDIIQSLLHYRNKVKELNGIDLADQSGISRS